MSSIHLDPTDDRLFRRLARRPLKFNVRCRIIAKRAYRKLAWWLLGIYIVDLERGSLMIIDNAGLKVDLGEEKQCKP